MTAKWRERQVLCFNLLRWYTFVYMSQLANSFISLDGYQDVSLLRLFPTDDGIGAVYGVTVASSSSADETDVNARVASNISPDGKLGNSGLSLAGSFCK